MYPFRRYDMSMTSQTHTQTPTKESIMATQTRRTTPRSTRFYRATVTTGMIALCWGLVLLTAGSAHAAISLNGLTMNGLTMNGIATNGLSMNGLTTNGLTMNGLSTNALSTNGLTMNGITTNGLSMNGIPMNGMAMNGIPMNGLPMNGLPMNSLSANGLTMNGLATNGLFVNGISTNGLLHDATNSHGEPPPLVQRASVPFTGLSQRALGKTWPYRIGLPSLCSHYRLVPLCL